MLPVVGLGQQLVDGGGEARVVLLVHAQALVEAHELGVLLLHARLQPLDAVLGRAVPLLGLELNRN